MKKLIFILFALIVNDQLVAQNLKKLGFNFDTKTYNFGDVEQWHNQAAVFTFTNKTKHPVTVLPLFNENDLEVILPENPIPVGGSFVIKAMYYTAGKGAFSRKFSIYFGSLAEPVYLRITGNIKSLSPEAYIQCPMSKPELAKPKIELIGDVAEIDTEIPLSGSVIEIIGLQNRKDITLYSSSKGKFASKLPIGNYQIKISHPNYVPYIGPFYIGQTSPPLRIRLTPINAPFIAQNTTTQTKKPNRDKEKYDVINLKNDRLKTRIEEKEPKKIDTYKESKETKKNIPIEKENSKINKPKKNEGLDRNIEYVKNDPKDNLYTKKNSKEAPHKEREITSNDDDYESEDPFILENQKDVRNKEPEYKKNEKQQTQKDKNRSSEPNKEKEINSSDKDKQTKEPEYKNNEKQQTQKDKNRPSEPNKEKELNSSDKDKQTREPVKRPIKKDEIVIPAHQYTFRVLDEKTLDPIEDASIFLLAIYDKKNKHKNQTDSRGYSELEIPKDDYRFIGTADGYISNEIRILKDDRSDVFKIFLAPISNLFDEIYESKKNEQNTDKNDVLDKLSFGKKTFSFAKDEPEEKEPELIASNEIHENEEEIARKNKEDSLKLYLANEELKNEKKIKELERIAYTNELEEKNKLAKKEKEDSLKFHNETLKNFEKQKELEKLTLEREKEKTLKLEIARENKRNEDQLAKIEEEKRVEKENLRDQEKLDSLNTYVAELIAKNNALEDDLDKVNNEKQDLESETRRNIEVINELNSKNKELSEPIDESILSKTEYSANNIIFLIDVSTSMAKEKKMLMLQKSIKNLVAVLRDIDRVAIITYNQKTNTVLESINGDNKETIFSAIDSLKTGGLTNGVRGITSAYEMLEYYFIPNGNNQIILATDGLFSKYNNDMTEYELNRLVKKQALSNMKLTVVGFGKDEDGKDLMTKLAKNGTGQYIQIKNDWMTNDILIREIQLNSKK